MNIYYAILDLMKSLHIYLPLSVTIYFLSSNISAFMKAKLQRKSFNGEIKMVSPSVLKECENIQHMEINYDNMEKLEFYVNQLISNISDKEKAFFDRNIQNLKVEKKRMTLLDKERGFYSIPNNKLLYRKDSVIGHELLHMSSSIYVPKYGIMFSGFSQEYSDNIIGNGLNEGYTDLLNKRIFNVDDSELCYYSEIRMAKMLELFFDDPLEMRKLYFSADLSGLVKQLEKYANREDVIKLITDIDDFSVLANEYSLLAKIKESSIYAKIYKMFISKCNDLDKINKLEQLINEDRFSSILFNNQKMKIYNEIYSDTNKRSR